MKKLAILTLGVLFTLLFPQAGNAATGDFVYFVAEKQGHSRIYKIQVGDGHSPIGSPIAVTTAATNRYVGDELTTDNQYLYFTDNFRNNTWDIVRTNLDGGERLVLVSGVSTPKKIEVHGVSIYFTTATGGLFRALSVGSSTPTLMIGPGVDAGLGSAPTSGYGSFVIANGKVVINLTNDTKLIQADASFASVSNATYISPAGYNGNQINNIEHVSDWYFLAAGNAGVYMTSDLTADVSSWDNPSWAQWNSNTGSVYRYIPASRDGVGFYSLWSNGIGGINHGGDMNDGPLVSSGTYTSTAGLVEVFDEELQSNTNQTLANTGLNSDLVFLAVVLLALGIALFRLERA